MRYFLDSNALVKLFHPEQGAASVTSIFADVGNRVYVSRLALIELTSAAAIKVRTGAMTPAEAAEFLSDVADTADAQKFLILSLREDDDDHAQRLLTRYALHLASAIRWRAETGIDSFVTADLHLAQAAELEGFATLMPANR